jgi:ATP-dependent DNA helicase RecQ
VNQVLKKLQEREVIAYTAKNNDAVLVFNEVREDDKTINRIAKYLENQNQLKVDQLESILHYVNDKNSCKSQLLLAYFGEKDTKSCGICSYCISKSKPKSDVALVTQSILENLKSADLNSREIEKVVPFATKDIIFALQLLLDNGIILLKTNNQYTLVK